jgi:hypothetical protein
VSPNRFRMMLWVSVVVLVLVAFWSSTYTISRDVVASSRTGCKRGIQERLNVLEENRLTIQGNKAIVADPKQPLATKTARREQYEGEEHIEKLRRERVDPAHGGKLICSRAYPDPEIIPIP